MAHDDSTRNGLRILFVEDHPDTARMMERGLARFGHHVRTADTLKAAEHMSQNHIFDLVLSDVSLPDGDGLHLIHKLWATHRIPGIAISGHARPFDHHAWGDAILFYMQKPIQMDSLKSVLDGLKNRRPEED